jgi:DNA-binding NtrC family response regulator
LIELRIKENILVVDDEPLTCELLEEVLTLQGHKPVVCSHPEEALIESERQRFALAFIDINLPYMNGLELASILRKRDSSCEFVFITGYGTIENAVEAVKFGAHDFLRKFFSITDSCLGSSKSEGHKLQDSDRISCTFRSCPQELEDVKVFRVL